jgi:putative salt-induced outer membrane protein
VGSISVAPGGMASLWRDDKDSPEAMSAQAEIEKYKPHWTYTVALGASQTEGNTDTRTVRGRMDIDRKTEMDLLKFYASADYAEQDDERTRNEYLGGIKYEHSFRPRWYWYTRGELEHDEFENLDLRATVAGGVGYYWIKKQEHELKTRVGAGYRHESFDSGRTEDDAIADLGLDYRLDVTTWMQFTQSTTYTPSLEDFGRYLLDFDTALAFPLKADEWKIKVGVQNKYNSEPDRGRERLDNLYYANVLLEIKR